MWIKSVIVVVASMMLWLPLAWAVPPARLVAEWDFTKAVPHHGPYVGKLRPDARLDSGLCNVKGDGKTGGGYVLPKVYPELSPTEGFRLEAVFSTGGRGASRHVMLYDNQYVNYKHANPLYNRGIMFYLNWRPASQDYEPFVSLGFGERSISLRGLPFPHVPGKLNRVSCSFDGVNRGWFEVNGKKGRPIRVRHVGGVSPASQVTVIGDRVNSSFNPFDGKIFQVRLFAFPRPDLALMLDVPWRRAFYQGEKDAVMRVSFTNTTKEDMSEVTLTAEGPLGVRQQFRLAVEAGKKAECRVPVETRLQVGRYPVTLTATYRVAGQERTKAMTIEQLICPPPKDPFPIVIWGYDLGRMGFARFRRLGFNSGIDYGYSSTFFRWPDMACGIAEDRFRLLDDMLFQGFHGLDSTLVNHYGKAYRRVGPDGKPLPGSNVDAAHPKLRAYVADVLKKTGTVYGSHPAYGGLLANSEVRDTARPSFGKHSQEDCLRCTGRPMPPDATDRLSKHYSQLRDFPFSRVIPDDYPLLAFYRWYWLRGDGWNPMQTLCSKVAKAAVGRPFWTWHDPAVRVPPLWGSGGEVDYLSHWTYASPCPIAIGVNTDEMFAMAKGRPGQRVINHTTMICYRSTIAPVGKKVKEEPAWVKEHPTCPFITIPPDLLKISVWTQISRQSHGVMFHGSDALLVNPWTRGNNRNYQCTNLDTQKAMAELLHQVVEPLGPVLKRVPERKPQVAVLESFASAVFAGHATWGWTSWAFDLNLMLQYAGLQPGVVYEEELLRDGFGEVKVLMMPNCEVLTEPVFKAITEFQRKGGIIVADELLVPGITPDIQIERMAKTDDPKEKLRLLHETGLELRHRLGKVVVPYASASVPDIVTHVRSDGDADFLFAVNDRRTFGKYVGAYGMVMEQGVEHEATVVVERKTGAVYDAVKHEPVMFRMEQGRTVIPLKFGPAEGRLLILMPKPVDKVVVEAPASCQPGAYVDVVARILDSQGQPVETLMPLEVSVLSAQGAKVYARPAALEKGAYRQTLTVPLNVQAGKWRVRVRDLASGRWGETFIEVK